jgi:tetratricopeptide (TPR) repeat protein
VEVHHGIVLVHGEGVPGGQKRLTAGQKLSSPTVVRTARVATEKAKAKPSNAAGVLDLDDPEAAGSAEAETAAEQPTRVRIAELATEPEQPPVRAVERRVTAAPHKPGPVPTDVEALLEEADRARSAGDHGEALKYFEQVIARAPKFDPRRGLAAMSVARLTMHGDPARAATALRHTLDGMPAGLSEHAHARLVEAYARSGQSGEARQEAERYLKRFPRGRRVSDVRRWAALP